MKLIRSVRVNAERYCCQSEDLLPYAGNPIPGTKEIMFCKHCGQLHASHRYTDAAGLTDSYYESIEVISWKWRD